MIVYAYVLCYNEMKLAPFAVQYWKQFANYVVVYDNGSNDGVVEYLSQFPELIEIRTYQSEGIDDEIYINIKNSAWKEARGKADYVVVGDFDECIYAPNIKDEFRKLSESNIDIVEPMWYNVTSDIFPDKDNSEFAHRQCKTGNFIKAGKRLIFNPNTVENINYYPGCHQCNPVGVNGKTLNIQYPSSIYCMHLLNMSEDFVVWKHNERHKRLTDKNRRRGWAVHYDYPVDKVIGEYKDALSTAEDISNL